MKVIRGDPVKLALDGRFDVIVHGCNCQCAMGTGIAKTIKQVVFPEAHKPDLATAKRQPRQAGVAVRGHRRTQRPQAHHLNGYTQFHWRGSGVLVDYDAVRSVMHRLKESYSGCAIGYPKIGAGLAKGDWSTIAAILEEELAGEDHTLVEYQP
ncbi:MAG: phosphatase [Hyphomicrobiaceae bacterium]|nr:phosphatase [Hyphomicrobiaceae bacterium]